MIGMLYNRDLRTLRITRALVTWIRKNKALLSMGLFIFVWIALETTRVDDLDRVGCTCEGGII